MIQSPCTNESHWAFLELSRQRRNLGADCQEQLHGGHAGLQEPLPDRPLEAKWDRTRFAYFAHATLARPT